MTSPRWSRLAAYASVALLLLVLGAALRPLVVAENPVAAPILDAVEIGFAQDMTAHHEQALIMAQRLDRGVDPSVSRLADQLDATQRIELGTMLGWLRLANATPTSARPMAWMGTETAASHQHSATPPAENAPVVAMPGLATMAELDALGAARGRDAEVLFLQLMFRHHQGGMAMAAAADELLPSGPVKELARSMVQQQGQEAGLMGMLLTQRHAAPLP
ncbi:DUF305 domain-containing protein [Nocardia callitridis]|uniref:DUF305 domain-containing protein n=1 Tax=Nocardia callitridis TaxID=648753 RepID=A0ABP9K5D0_9NOCA